MFSFTVRRSVNNNLEVLPEPPMSNDLFVVLDIPKRAGKVYAIGMDGHYKHWTEVKLDAEPGVMPTPEEVACSICLLHIEKSLDEAMGKVEEAKKYDFSASMLALNAVQGWLEGRGSREDVDVLVSQILGRKVKVTQGNVQAVRAALRALVRQPVMSNIELLKRAAA